MVYQKMTLTNIIIKHFPKMYRDVRMAVPKPQKLGVAYKHCTNNPIPTASIFFHAQCRFPVISKHNQRKMSCTKKDVGMGLFVQCLYALSLHLVSVVFGTAIPTSLYIFGQRFIYFFNCISVCELPALK